MKLEEISKDVHLLNHPEPLEIITHELKTLKDTQYIKMIHRRIPLKLFEILAPNHFCYKVVEIGRFEDIDEPKYFIYISSVKNEKFIQSL